MPNISISLLLACTFLLLNFFGNSCSQEPLPVLGFFAMANTVLLEGSKTPNFGSIKMPFEQICARQPEYFVESDGRDSTVIFDFKALKHSKNNSNNKDAPGRRKPMKSCVRILSAPVGYDFIVRLIIPKLRHGKYASPHRMGKLPAKLEKYAIASSSSSSSGSGSAESSSQFEQKDAGTLPTHAGVESNFTASATTSTTTTTSGLKRTCPLHIFSSSDPDTAQWRIDPCQLEDAAPQLEDPVRLLHGRIRIVWEHHNQELNSKLMITALGKGELCKGEHKHQCLKVGDEPILCISKDLTCDGVRHCPYRNEYNSDEDYAMCWESHRLSEPLPTFVDSDIFEHMAIEMLHGLFAHDIPDGPSGKDKSEVDKIGGNSNATAAHMNGTEPSIQLNTKLLNETALANHNVTRNHVRSDMSKYGPWGYLMFGVLLCGAAILICGLWITAAQSNHADANVDGALGAGSAHGREHSELNSPPNYEELDPPPAYSVLFPNQKSASATALEIVNESAAPAARAAANTANEHEPAESSNMIASSSQAASGVS